MMPTKLSRDVRRWVQETGSDELREWCRKVLAERAIGTLPEQEYLLVLVTGELGRRGENVHC